MSDRLRFKRDDSDEAWHDKDGAAVGIFTGAMGMMKHNRAHINNR